MYKWPKRHKRMKPDKNPVAHMHGDNSQIFVIRIALCGMIFLCSDCIIFNFVILCTMNSIVMQASGITS